MTFSHLPSDIHPGSRLMIDTALKAHWTCQTSYIEIYDFEHLALAGAFTREDLRHLVTVLDDIQRQQYTQSLDAQRAADRLALSPEALREGLTLRAPDDPLASDDF